MNFISIKLFLKPEGKKPQRTNSKKNSQTIAIDIFPLSIQQDGQSHSFATQKQIKKTMIPLSLIRLAKILKYDITFY